MLVQLAIGNTDYSGNSFGKPVALDKFNDQIVLGKIAVEAKNAKVSREAFKKLTDQTILAKIALEDNDTAVRQAAAAKVIDRTMLARVAVGTKSPYVRQAAENKEAFPRRAAKPGDQVLRGKISLEQANFAVRRATPKMDERPLD